MTIKDDILSKSIFIATCAVSVILIIAGFCLPPQGVIDPSVLTAVGEMFGFAALAQVRQIIKDGKTAKIKTTNAELTIGESKNTNDLNDEE